MLVETAKMFGCFPTDVLDSSAENMRYLKILALGTPPQQEEMEPEEDYG